MAENDKTFISLTTAQLDAAHEANHVDPNIIAQGQEFVRAEKALPQSKALRTHWKGVFFSIALSFALVMEGEFPNACVAWLQLMLGYDVIMGAFFGQPQFQRYFGTQHEDGTYLVNANWQTAISNVQTTTNLIGLLITGICQERYGSKKTYIGGMILMTMTIFVAVFAQNIQMYLAAEALMALPWGMFREVPITLSRLYD
jgi:SP family general alpha glucoside:H+ symporter-like MFS transporter